ncbi:MAG: hypothetical protein MUF64_10055 [Polyangiaceae bacterium]|nr:hypothetical protein [Polyangiaceae bacterium]
MSNRVPLFALVIALVAGVLFAFLRKDPPATPEPEAAPRPSAVARPKDQLPPGHPPIPPGSQGAAMGAHGTSAPEPGALTWTAPPRWASAPNPSTMRLATYKIPKAGKDPEDAELSISRAGGSTEANLQRWVGQFEGASKDSRNVRKIEGLTVTTIEVSGAYAGGMMGGAPSKKEGWALLGAVIETPGSSYFFKMTGPKATVEGARDEFHKMLDSIKQSKP